MRNISRVDFDKMKIHENLQALKGQDLKVGYKLKLDDEKTYRDKRVISKILKLDENNHYGYAITKPLPTGCIKNQKKMLTGWEFNMLLERVSLEDKIDHLFVVNIRFNKDLVTFTQLIYNKLYCSIFEKQKMLDAYKKDTRNDTWKTVYFSLPLAFAVSNQNGRIESDKIILSLCFRLGKV